jgi:hypothetical protein
MIIKKDLFLFLFFFLTRNQVTTCYLFNLEKENLIHKNILSINYSKLQHTRRKQKPLSVILGMIVLLKY